MGRGMALNLVKKGFDVTVSPRSDNSAFHVEAPSRHHASASVDLQLPGFETGTDRAPSRWSPGRGTPSARVLLLPDDRDAL